MTVEFDPDERVWVFTVADKAEWKSFQRYGVFAYGAPVSITLGGLSWTVGNLRCTSPIRVEVAEDAGAWAKAALRSLLGDEAADAVDGDGDPQADQRIVRVDPSSSWRRAAMGMLALASTSPTTMMLRAVDVAALAHRAGLDTLGEPFPAGERLADDVVEALDFLPEAIEDALDGPEPSNRGAYWRVARQGLADARSFVYAVSGADLPHVDVDATFEALMAGIGDELVAAAEASSLSGDLGTRMGETGGVRGVDAYVVDPTIRGVVGVVARHGADRHAVEITLSSRATAEYRKVPLYARVIGQGSGGVLAHTELHVHLESNRPRLVGTCALADDDEPIRVEIVRDPRQPEMDLGTARDADYQCELLEGERVLRQVGSMVGDNRASVKRLRENLAEALMRGPFGDLDPSFRPDAYPLPSDGLMALFGDRANEIIEELNRIDDPARRAAHAHNTALLASWSMVPWVQRLIGDLCMIEATAADEVEDAVSRSIDAASRAELYYVAAGEAAKATEAREFVDERNQGGAG